MKIIEIYWDKIGTKTQKDYKMANELIALDTLKDRIFTIRGKRVMIDRDLAELYGVETKKLNQAVKRNIERFPDDFMFQLTNEEQSELVTNCDHLKNLKFSYQNAYVFTEHGVTMLSSVLKSKKAIEINVQVVRAFIALRQFAIENQALANKINQLEQYLISHIKDNRAEFKQIYDALNLLMDRTKPSQIGFKAD